MNSMAKQLFPTAAWPLLLLLAGCGSSAPETTAINAPNVSPAVTTAVPVNRPSSPAPVAQAKPVASGMSPAPQSCSAEVGLSAATRRVAVCRNVSPATRPPCNVANSCAMIENEIARSCALFDGEGPPMLGCGPAPKSMEAAAAVVRLYYSAIDAHDYGTAWAQWGENGQPGQTYAAFVSGFARTRSTRVTIGTLKPGEGGAGSVYQSVPVQVTATLDDGTLQRFAGTYLLHRVNDVDGATAAQLRWNLNSAELRPVIKR